MVSINTIYIRFYALLNKSQVGGSVTVEEFNNYAAMANWGLLSKDYEVFQRTSKITDRVRKFIHKKPYFANGTGHFSYPNNYFYRIALRTYDYDEMIALKTSCDEIGETPNYSKVTQIEIKILDNNQLGVRNKSKKYRPTVYNPCAVFYDDYIQLFPIDLGYATIDYLVRPTVPLWSYTTDTYGLPVFDSANSIDFEWSDTCENALLMEILAYAGVEIRDIDIYKTSQELEATGQ